MPHFLNRSLLSLSILFLYYCYYDNNHNCYYDNDDEDEDDDGKNLTIFNARLRFGFLQARRTFFHLFCLLVLSVVLVKLAL